MKKIILRILPLISLLYGAGTLHAQVTFDAASNATPATASAANPVLVQWNHTVGLSKKPYLVVSVAIDRSGSANPAVTGVIWGNEAGGPTQNMVLLGAINNGSVVRSELWGLSNPTPGTHQIQVSVSNTGAATIAVVAGAKSFFNVFQTAAASTAVTAIGTSLTPSVAVTNGAFDYVVDSVAYNGNSALTPGGSQTNAYNVPNAAPAFSGAGSTRTGANNVTMSWTATGAAQAWATVAVALKSATPQIVFDRTSNNTFSGNTNGFTGSWNHTVTNAANRILVVGVSLDRSGNANVQVSGVRYGTEGGGPNVAMTLIPGTAVNNGTAVRVEMYYLLNPLPGNHQITVTVQNTSNVNVTVIAGGQSFSNIDQSNPFGTVASATGNSATPTVAVTNSAYDYVVDELAFNGNTAQIEGAQQDRRYANNTNTLTNFAGAGSGSRGYLNTTMSWSNATATSQNWALVAVPLHQVTVGLQKTASADVIKLGGSITYTITATNYTNAAVNNVTITDNLPAGSAFVSQTGCAGTGPVTCNIGTLGANAVSAPITITITPNSAGTTSNNATLTYTGAATAISSETVNTLVEGRVCATPGKDGAGGTLAGIKNDYWPGTSSPVAGATTMTIGARVGGGGGNTISAGDLLILMQMQDAAFDTTNDETYGEGTGSTKATGTGSGAATTLNNAGRWEYVIAANSVGAGGGTLNINGGGAGGGTLYGYTSQSFATTTTQGQRTWQVIRVPQYTTATLSSTLMALPWNGSTGGVLAIDVSGTLSLGGATVSVNGLGFRGGAGRVLGGDATAGLAATDFRTLATLTTNGSKGEGITGTPRYVYQSGANIGAPGANSALDTGVEGYVGGSYGRGAPGNSGGGSTDGDPPGNDDNSGGGGGGNGGNGGAGGFGWNCRCASGGQGGGSISPSLTRISMGGGGGSGTSNNGSAADATGAVIADTGGPNAAGANGYYSSGANGGGVIIMRALQATGTGTLTANGFNAANVGRDGGGGGGAGGAVLFTTQVGTLTGLTVQANGGNGGNAWLQQPPGGNPGERHGPGGGGGGGYVLLSSNTAASVTVNPGTNGLTDTANDSYGAQPGTTGIVQFITGNNVLPGGDGASCAITDLAVTNTDSPDPVMAGNNITYTQTVTNNGPSAADSVVYMAPIPAYCTFQSVSVPAGWTCITPAVGGTGVVTCTTPTLASGATANFSLVVTNTAQSGYVIPETNSVSCSTPDSNPANNQATTTTLVISPQGEYADMAVTISENTALPTPGSNINYTQTITNNGNFTATTPSYSFTTPPNTTFQSLTPPAGWTCITPAVGGTGTINCSAASMAAGASVSMPLTLKVNAGTPPGTAITATPSVSSVTTDTYLPNNTASVTATVVAAGSGDLAITISNSPSPVAPADTYTYTAIATNNGPSASPNVTVSIPIPAGVGFRSLTPPAGWACVTPAVGASGTITCTIASLASGATATFSPVVQVNASTASGTTLNCTATISTTGTDSIAANNTASCSNLVTAASNADIAIVKTDSPDPVQQLQYITYRLAVTNNGPAVANNVTINDPLDATTTLIRVNPSVGTCAGTTTINCSLGSLAVGNTQYVDLVVQANSAGTVTNTATAATSTTDPIPANNTSTAPTTVVTITLVRLRTTSAVQNKEHVLITWQTSFESNNLGFNLYRDVNGVRTKINKKIIAGSALATKKNNPSASYSYRYNDKVPANTYPQYWLEDVDINGTLTMHGPIVPSGGTIPDGEDSPALSGLGASGSVLQSPVGIGVLQPLVRPAPTDKQTKTQLDLASDTALKIFVSQEGWYRISTAQMTAAGFDPGKDEKKLSLYTGGTEVPIVAGSDGIEFYGLPLDTPSTGARTYWLRAGKGNGARLDVSNVKGGDPVSGSLPFVYDRKERSVFFSALINNGDATNFFGAVIGNWGPSTEELITGALDPAWGGNASLTITLQGGTEPIRHMVDLSINGHDIGIATLDDQQQKTLTLSFPQSFLTSGSNTLSMIALNGDNDISVVADVRLTYQHLLTADNGQLEIAVPGGRAVSVSGFTSSAVRAIDVTNPENPVELQTTVANGTATFTPAASGSRSVLVFDASRILSNAELALNRPSSWSDGKSGADLLIITNPLFSSAASSLVAAKQREGVRAAVVDIDDVYDESNFGVRDPQAIRAFLRNAAQWKTPPRWVLLLGDASFDPRNYLEMGAYDFVPTMLMPTAYMKTASDDALTDFDGDGIADIPVGRIPARTAADASLVVNRIASRGTPSGPWASNALFIAEPASDFDFPAAARAAAGKLPPSIASRVIGSNVASAMNDGALLVDFIGHGSVELWGEPLLYTSADATASTNANRLPFVVAMTCLTGFFHDLYTTSMAEALLQAPNGGAIAVWGSSTLTEPDQQALMNNELMRQLFTPGVTIGEAARRAKMATADRDVRTSWILFGDPSMKIK